MTPAPQQRKYLFWAVLFFCVAVLFFKTGNGSRPQTITPPALIREMRAGTVQQLSFTQGSLEVSGLMGSDKNHPSMFQVDLATQEQLNQVVDLAGTQSIKYHVIPAPHPPWWASMIEWVPYVLIFLYFIYIMEKQAKAQSKFISRDRRFTVDKKMVKARFADVAGCEEAKEEVADIVQYLRNPLSFNRLGGRVPHGVLLEGPPGTGKTLLAKAVAGEADVPFLAAKGSEFIELFVGVGASRVRVLFEEARKCAPCVIFIDEIDAIGKKRGVAIGGGHDEREQTLNQLLTEIDGFEQQEKPIIILAATNRSDVLDDALMRSGRFDRQVSMPRPDRNGRFGILRIHGRDKKMAPDVDLMAIAKDTGGMVGADLENVLNEAALEASKKRKEWIDQADLHEAVDKVSMGKARKSMKISDKEKRMTAYHEGGHTLVAMLTEGADPVHKVTIIPRGPALGFTKQLPEEDRYSHTKAYLLTMLRVLAGGRVAEEMIFGKENVTTGASDDFRRATQIARKMVFEFGMSDAGLSVYQDTSDFWGKPTGVDASPTTKEKLENEVERILQDTTGHVRELLEKNRKKLDALAEALLEKETLQVDEIASIIHNAPST
ncbi:MAG: ATP-dependent zinc metalloprotease FtsH [Patescibacteria group bacterium]|nr:ATP-dependent zinc metalloprotease FtsH [Patescibacteria group bacterium]